MIEEERFKSDERLMLPDISQDEIGDILTFNRRVNPLEDIGEVLNDI